MNEAHSAYAVRNKKLHVAIDETRAEIDSNIMKLVVSQLYDQLAME